MNNLPKNLSWSIIKNSISQISGRLFLSLSRLIIMLLIVRGSGVELFGQYAVTISMLMIAEWIVDFGSTQIAVFEISQSPEKKKESLQALMILRVLQALAAYFALTLAVFVFNFEQSIVNASLIGGCGLIFYAGALVYRVLFTVKMDMGKDVTGEAIGVAVMIPLIWLAGTMQLGVEVLAAIYALSKVVYFFIVMYFGRSEFQIRIPKIVFIQIVNIAKQAWPIGVAGLVVASYDSVAPIMLSKLLGMESAGQYVVSLRFIYPAVLVTQAITATFYPVLSTLWKKDPESFKNAQQNALEVSFIMGSILFCAVYTGAEFLMNVVSPDLVEAAYVLRILSLAVLARTINTAMYQLIIITGTQKKLLGIYVVIVALKIALVWWLVPLYGLLGALYAYVGIEFVVTLIPTIIIAQSAANIRMAWTPIFRTALAAAIAVFISMEMVGIRGLGGAILATILFSLLAIGLGAVSIKKLRLVFSDIRSR